MNIFLFLPKCLRGARATACRDYPGNGCGWQPERGPSCPVAGSPQSAGSSRCRAPSGAGKKPVLDAVGTLTAGGGGRLRPFQPAQSQEAGPAGGLCRHISARPRAPFLRKRVIAPQTPLPPQAEARQPVPGVDQIQEEHPHADPGAAARPFPSRLMAAGAEARPTGLGAGRESEAPPAVGLVRPPKVL